MQIYKGHQTLDRQLKSPIVTIGNFDGLHLGHAKIIDEVVKRAKTLGAESVVYTFRPHPQIALNPEKTVELVCTYDEKLALLANAGVDVVIEEPFSREFSNVRPEIFFNDILLGKLSAQAIIVGYDFAFGKGREGHLEQLTNLCRAAKVSIEVIPPFKCGAEVASSSRIRAHAKAGDLRSVSLLLGRAFSYTGVVMKGEGRGRKIGFPTANLFLGDKLNLPNGVYATRATIATLGLLKIKSVTNIGVRPTFIDGAEAKIATPIVEVHLLDTDKDLYGEVLTVEFIEKLRDEKRFGNVNELLSQIRLDIKRSVEILTSSKP